DPSPRLRECTAVGQLTVYTSGTTGAPKASTKDVAEIFARKRGHGDPGDRWLLTYHPFRWAGISTISHALRFGCQLVVPTSLELADVLDAAPRATHVSLTPSLFRKMMLVASESALAALPLRQVTFGGEEATQAVLDAAHRLWPDARVTHTYASTEL